MVPKNRAARRSFWLIATWTHGEMEVFTIAAGGETVLPIFSFREEAELFLRLEAKRADWWLRETSTGELASLLLGLCARADKVALDPLPGPGEREILGLGGTGRRLFVRRLLGEVAAHSERKYPPGQVTVHPNPAGHLKGRTRHAQLVGRPCNIIFHS
jgi:hypothetical protein